MKELLHLKDWTIKGESWRGNERKGTAEKVFKPFARKWLKLKPETGLDCLLRAEFARQRDP